MDYTSIYDKTDRFFYIFVILFKSLDLYITFAITLK